MFKRKKSKDAARKLWEAYLKASLKQDWEKAKDTLQQIIKLEPGNSRTHLKMGDLLQKMGDIKEAKKAYHRSANILVKSGFGQKALALYKIILRLDPKDKEAMNASQSLLEAPAPSGQAIPALSLDESPPSGQGAQAASPPSEAPEVESPALEGFATEEAHASAEPAPEEFTTQGMPSLAGWPEAGEKSHDKEPKAVDWPDQVGMPSGWPEEEASTPEPEAKDSMPELPELQVEGSQEGDAAPRQWSGPVPEMFWSLTKEELAQIASDSSVHTFHSGDTVVKEGDSGDSIYAIMEGSAKVTTTFGGKQLELASLGAGDVFGEVAFLSGKPRTATIVSDSDAKVIDISRAVLEKAIDKHPRILSCLAEYYHNHVRDTITKVKKAKKPKTRFTIRD
jgi:hypothetical protein